MPDSLSNRIPDHDPGQDTVDIVGVSALGLFPVVGGVVSSVVGGVLASRAQARNVELFRAVAAVVDELVERVDGLTPEAIAEDPRFLATAEKVVRAAQETANDAHRQRLIRALRHAGPWSQQEPFELDRMTDLLTRLGPVHIFIMRFFADPAEWLSTNAGDAWARGTETVTGTGTLVGIFTKYVFPHDEVPSREIIQVTEELVRESIMTRTRDPIMQHQMSGTGLVEPRLTDFGRSFLAFAEGELDP